MPNTLTEWFRHVPEEKWLRDPAASRADAKAIWEKLDLKPGVHVFECPCGKADLGFPLARSGALVQLESRRIHTSLNLSEAEFLNLP